MKKVVLIDGYSLLHRAYFALPKTITTSDGKPINAVYGFTRMLIKVLKDLRPDYMALVYDTKGPTFRDEFYDAYKKGRPVMEATLEEQLGRVAEVVEAMDLKVFARPGFEADDLMATIVDKVKESNVETIVVTGDNDLLQLVSNKVKVYFPQKGLSEPFLYYDIEVVKKFGFPPRKIVDYKALRGDPSDNIPGVKGIGEKISVELLKRFKDLASIYKNIDKVDTRVAKLLEGDKDSAYLSLNLAKLKRDVPIEFKLEDLKLKLDKHKVLEVFRQLGFRSLIKQLTRESQFEEQSKRPNQPNLI